MLQTGSARTILGSKRFCVATMHRNITCHVGRPLHYIRQTSSPQKPKKLHGVHFTADTVIVITGSSRGLGLEFVKHFLEYTDSKVVATARSLSKADDLRTLMTQYSKRLQMVALDTSEESSIEVTHAGQTQLGVHASVGLDDYRATVDVHTVSTVVME